MAWDPPKRPGAYAEDALITAVLDGTFPIGSSLPGERTLAGQLGVTRPTLREVIRRLERDGWLMVQQGKATVVNNYWQDGGLNVISTLVQHAPQLPPNFVLNLLQVRLDLAPSYTVAAVTHNPEQVETLFQEATTLADTAVAFAAYDWHMHRTLTIASNNPVYTLILNGFAGFYEKMAQLYFVSATNRQTSRTFYQTMLEISQQRALTKVKPLVTAVMQASIDQWPGDL